MNYYCKQCGAQYTNPQAVVCIKCGTARGKGDSFCNNCGNPVAEGAAVCLSCGCSLKTSSSVLGISSTGAKSKLVAGLLGIFLGSLGIHNFYLGNTQRAVLQLVLSVIGWALCWLIIPALLPAAMSIWGLIEGIYILVGKIDTDANGNPLGD
ncbi:MAG: NINE protein [Oscillospiraceae bacterium]|nr:NINE protein [Oscillospiraceae bacterium]